MNEQEDAQRKLRVQANAAALDFLSEQLNSNTQEGVPPPPKIEIDEVSAMPVKLDFIGFGTQGSSTQSSGHGSGPPPEPTGDPTGACCILGGCSDLTETACDFFGGIYQGDAVPCSPDPC